jgi:hypothetical protein
MEHKPGSSRCIKRWEKAEGHCLASAELKPKYEEGWVGLGRSQLEQGVGRWDDAEATLRAFLASHPSGGHVGSMVGVARELLADLAHRRSSLHGVGGAEL